MTDGTETSTKFSFKPIDPTLVYGLPIREIFPTDAGMNRGNRLVRTRTLKWAERTDHWDSNVAALVIQQEGKAEPDWEGLKRYPKLGQGGRQMVIAAFSNFHITLAKAKAWHEQQSARSLSNLSEK